MTFTPNIPQATDLISNSQAQMLGNFQFLGNTTGNVVNGFYNLPNGLIMQWGQTTIASATSRVISFNLPYTTAVYSIQVTRYAVRTSPPTDSPSGYFIQDTSITISGFRIVNDDGIASGFFWFAIGL